MKVPFITGGLLLVMAFFLWGCPMTTLGTLSGAAIGGGVGGGRGAAIGAGSGMLAGAAADAWLYGRDVFQQPAIQPAYGQYGYQRPLGNCEGLREEAVRQECLAGAADAQRQNLEDRKWRARQYGYDLYRGRY